MRYLLCSLIIVIFGCCFAGGFFGILKKQQIDGHGMLTKDTTNVCKGFAIVIIMLAHISNLFNIRYMTPCGAWGVSIFLFLSGYGLELSYRKNGLKDFVKKRLLTAYLPFVVIELITIVGYFSSIDNIALCVIKSLLLIEPIHPYGWYMQCLFIYYITFYISKVFFVDTKWFKWVVYLIVSLLTLCFLRSLFKQQIFTFVLGVFVADNKEKLVKYFDSIKLFVLFFIIGFFMIALRQINAIRLLPDIIYNLLISIESTCLMLATMGAFNVLINKLPGFMFIGLNKVGQISFELYLIHAFVIIFILAKNLTYLNILIFFIVSILTAILFYILRTKLLNLIFKSKKACRD